MTTKKPSDTFSGMSNDKTRYLRVGAVTGEARKITGLGAQMAVDRRRPTGGVRGAKAVSRDAGVRSSTCLSVNRVARGRVGGRAAASRSTRTRADAGALSPTPNPSGRPRASAAYPFITRD